MDIKALVVIPGRPKGRGTSRDKRLHDVEVVISRLLGIGTPHEGRSVKQCKACQKRLRARAKRKA